MAMARLGLFADLHYAEGTREGTRCCALGLEKLRLAMREFEEKKVDLVVGLGDLVDSGETVEQEAGYLREVCEVLRRGGRPFRLVPGNHCVWTLSKQEFCEISGQGTTWGKLELGGWRLLFLDGCFRYDGEAYGRRNSDWREARISDEQVRWLERELAAGGRPTLVFVHQRLDCEPPYGVANAREIRRMIEASGRVRGVYQGHEHNGALSEIGGIPYRTLPAMVEGQDVSRRTWMILELDGEELRRLDGKVLTGPL